MWDQVIIFFAQYVYLVITGVAFCFVVFSDSLIRKKVLMIGIVSSLIALIADKILNRIIISSRPFVVENISPLVSHVADNGFPSEHTLLVMIIAGIIFLFHKKMGIFLGILALMVGVGSVIAKVHHPVDILGSIVIAIISILASSYIISRFRNKTLSTS